MSRYQLLLWPTEDAVTDSGRSSDCELTSTSSSPDASVLPQGVRLWWCTSTFLSEVYQVDFSSSNSLTGFVHLHTLTVASSREANPRWMAFRSSSERTCLEEEACGRPLVLIGHPSVGSVRLGAEVDVLVCDW